MGQPTLEVVATYVVNPGSIADVLMSLKELAEASRREEGNYRYEYFQGVEDPAKIVILESYSSETAFQLHRKTEHFKRLGVGTIIPLLQSRSVATYLAMPGTGS